MPQRQSNTKRVEGGPQGEDAFVTIQRLTIDEGETFSKLFANIDPATAEQREAEVRSRMAEILLGWNWVFDDGSPMPSPHDNVGLIGKLYSSELEWLMKAIMGNTEGEKKG